MKTPSKILVFPVCSKLLFISVAVLVICGCLFSPFKLGDEGATPLMTAAKAGDTEQCRILLAQGDDPNVLSSYGWTPLMFACWQGHLDTAELLVNSGADPNLVSGWVPSGVETVMGHPPSTALQEAVRNGHLDISLYLLSENRAFPDPGAVALAARDPEMSLFAKFKSLGVDWNRSSGNAFSPTPLVEAARNNQVELAKWLLAEGADPDLVTVGQSPLKGAVEASSPEITTLLLNAGANPSRVFGSGGDKPVSLAATRYTHEKDRTGRLEVLRLLIEAGGDADVTMGSYTPVSMVQAQIKSTQKYIKKSKTEESKARFQASLKFKKQILEILLEASDCEAPEVEAFK